jgi:hypothetical protein
LLFSVFGKITVIRIFKNTLRVVIKLDGGQGVLFKTFGGGVVGSPSSKHLLV